MATNGNVLTREELLRDKSAQHGWCRFECEIMNDDICRLTVNYSGEQVQEILEAAEKGKFVFIFGKVHYPNGRDLFVSITPPEVTAIRNHHPDKTNVIVGFFYCNVFEIWVSKSAVEQLFSVSKEIEISETKLPVPHGNFTVELIQKSRELADEVGLKRWERGERLITPSSVCDEVAALLEKDVKNHGSKGAFGREAVRKYGLKYWQFMPPSE